MKSLLPSAPCTRLTLASEKLSGVASSQLVHSIGCLHFTVRRNEEATDSAHEALLFHQAYRRSNVARPGVTHKPYRHAVLVHRLRCWQSVRATSLNNRVSNPHTQGLCFHQQVTFHYLKVKSVQHHCECLDKFV